MNKHFLVVDLEATCDDNEAFLRSEMEIIEIGAVMVESKTFSIISEYQDFVKPVLHPNLTDFCKELTSIRQSDVDEAKAFPEVLSSFLAWADACINQEDDYLFCSWGAYDRGQLEQDCKLHKLSYPFEKHLNLKEAFRQSQQSKTAFGLRQALERLDLSFIGNHHRGIDDAKNIARILPFIDREFLDI